MAPIVETGAGLADADALVSVAFVDAYFLAKGSTTWTGTDTLKEAAIRRATAFMSDGYTWAGYRSKNRDQALAWPRSGVIDAEGNGIDSDEIPIEVKRATAEIALRELITPGAMTPDFTRSDLVKREKIDSIEIEYALAGTSAEDQRPVLTIVRDMIGQFLLKSSGNRLAGASVRV